MASTRKTVRVVSRPRSFSGLKATPAPLPVPNAILSSNAATKPPSLTEPLSQGRYFFWVRVRVGEFVESSAARAVIAATRNAAREKLRRVGQAIMVKDKRVRQGVFWKRLRGRRYVTVTAPEHG